MNMLTKNWPKLLAAVLVAAILPGTALAVGEENGRIRGTITEAQTGAPVPGATVTASSPSLIGEPHTTTTDDLGNYEFSNLVPGSYAVDVTYSGVKPIRRQVLVQQGTTTPLDIQWSAELAQVETTVVQEERHLTRPDSTMTGTVFSGEGQQKIGTVRSYQAVALESAGVASPNNAGNPQIKGANQMGNRYLLDGLDVGDPILNTFSLNLNFDSIESLQIITGGMEAQYNTPGGIINVISTRGSDEFHADASVYGNHYKLSLPNQFGSQFYDYTKPFVDTPRPPTQSYDLNANVSGPLIKHTLWFAGGFQYSNNQSSQPAGPPLNVQAPNRVSNTYLGRLKLTWAPVTQHRLTASAVTDPATFDFVAFNGPGANTTTPLAATRQNQGSLASNLTWEFFPAESFSTRLQVGAQWGSLDNGPQGVYGKIDPKNRTLADGTALDYQFDRPRHVNNDEGIAYFNAISKDVNRRRGYTGEIAAMWRGRALGYHDAQVGIQTRFTNFDRWLTRTGNGIEYQDAGGGPGIGGLCDDGSGTTGVNTGNRAGCFRRNVRPFSHLKADSLEAGMYIQDRWAPTKWLKIIPGLRWDIGRSYNNAFGDFPVERVANVYGFGPRLGAILDLTGDQKTIFSAFYGRIVDVRTLLVGSNTQRTDFTFVQQWNGTTWAPFQTVGGNDYYKLDPKNSTAPHTDEIDLRISREFFKNSVVELNYTYKKISNQWDAVEVNSLIDPTGTRTIGYADGVAHNVGVITTPAKNYLVYNGFDLSLEGRPNPNLDLYGAYTLSWRTGVSDENFGQTAFLEPGQLTLDPFQNPRLFGLAYGYLQGDIRHTLKGHGYFIFHGFSVGPNFTYRTGVTQRRVFSSLNLPQGVGAGFPRAPNGTEPGTGNDPNQISEFKTPDLLTLNVRVTYDFYDLLKQHLTLIGDVFNVLNAAVPSTLQENNTIPINRFGEIQARTPAPFRVQFGIRYQY